MDAHKVQFWHSRKFFISSVILILLCAFLTRFLEVDQKPFHHDESLHAYYSYNVAQGIPHKYDALLHGPFLYYFVAPFLKLFGHTDFAAHLPASIFGVLLVALPLILVKNFGGALTLVLMALLCLSPLHTYFGRFLREDVFTSYWTLGSVFGIGLYWFTRSRAAAFFVTVMMALHFTNKENSYLHAFIFITGILFLRYLSKVWSYSDQLTLPLEPKPNKRFWLLCFGIFSVIFISFFSAFFMHPDGWYNGVIDGIYRKSLLYWWDQNKMRRIDGPFDYHVPILANYEFILLPFLASAWFRVVLKSRSLRSEWGMNKLTQSFTGNIMFLKLSGWLLILMFVPNVALDKAGCAQGLICLNELSPAISGFVHEFARLLHITSSRHFLQLLLYVFAGLVAVTSAMHVRRPADAFLWFWFTGAIGTYSYVGEKVPWLTVYIALPMLVISSLEIVRIYGQGRLEALEPKSSDLAFGWKPIYSYLATLWFLLAVPFTGYKLWQSSFENPASPVERIVFTQTTQETHSIATRWRTALMQNRKMKIAVYGDGTWPFAWYMKGHDASFSQPDETVALTYDAIMIDMAQMAYAKNLSDHFDIYELPLRSWWVPKPHPTWSEILNYFFLRQSFPKVEDEAEALRLYQHPFGASRILYLEKKGLASEVVGLLPITYLELR